MYVYRDVCGLMRCGGCCVCLKKPLDLSRLVLFEVFTALSMKNTAFWDVAKRKYCVIRRFGGMYRLHLQGKKISNRGTSLSRWLQTDNLTVTCEPMV
jgi:hypothetical protein